VLTVAEFVSHAGKGVRLKPLACWNRGFE